MERRLVHMPEDEEEPAPAVRAEQSTVMGEQTTLVQNEEEAFALEPLDITHIGQYYLMLFNWLQAYMLSLATLIGTFIMQGNSPCFQMMIS